MPATNKHPDPIFEPQELAIIHDYIHSAVDDAMDNYYDMAREDAEERAEQYLIELQNFVQILKKIELRISIISPTARLAIYHDRLVDLLGPNYLQDPNA